MKVNLTLSVLNALIAIYVSPIPGLNWFACGFCAAIALREWANSIEDQA
jgi:hypothetical protein